jgi:transposase-like protein
LQFMAGLRWPDGKPECPRCQCKESRFVKTRSLWECKECRKQYSVKVGTIFEDSPIKLDTWICAMWLIVNAKNGISSYEIERSLGVSQKTGWFMLHRIRYAMQTGSFVKLGGTVEVDESWIGADARRMNAKQKAKRKHKGTGPFNKTPVQGLLERGEKGKHGKASRIVLRVVADNKKRTLDPNVREYVLKGSQVMTDEHKGYEDLDDEYTHNIINHAEAYAKGNVHTNGLENFWSLLKRAIRGTYVNVEPFHLFRYLDEQAFRFNERKDDDKGRFLKAVVGIIGKRLTWHKLTGKDILPESLPAT